MPRIAVDLRPLRASREFRLLQLGAFITSMGTQATLVAIPYQLYTQTHSPLLTGLTGLVELVPLMSASLLSGALADRMDRRRLLLVAQLALMATAILLTVLTFAGSTPVGVIYVLAGLLAAASALDNVAQSAMVPNLVPDELLRPALALNYGLITLAQVAGPALGGLLIAAAGVKWAYAGHALSCFALTAAAVAIGPQLPQISGAPSAIRADIAEGLRFVRGNAALQASFLIDLAAMTFGMPRALFPVLSISVYHAGAAGTGVLLASVSAGATIAALTTGWLHGIRRIGRVVVWCVIGWGLAITGAGLAGTLWLAAVLLAVAGAADSISAVCRTTINQTVTPDEMRGRMSSVFMLVVTSGPRLGDAESGTVASLASPRFSVVSGGLACILGAGLVALAFPALVAYDADAASG